MLPGLNTMWLGKSFVYFDEIDSTNIYLKEHAHELPHGCAVVARRQTRGKGRLGREWVQSGDILALSILLHNTGVERLAPLPLAAGVGVVKALKSVTRKEFSLKWSNDVLFENQKLCGILCESRISADNAFAVVGIGVNISQSRQDFDRLGLVYATSLGLATNKNFDVLQIAAEICNQFEPIFMELQKKGFAAIMEEYKRNCVTIGKEVRVIAGGREQTGVALDVAEDGGLICDIGGKIEHIRANEASVRGIYGYV